MMVTEKISNVSKVWFRFSRTLKNEKKMTFRWEELPEHRFDEFIDFKMNYYVKHEITHIAAGIHKNSDAMEEYKQIVSKLFKQPAYQTAICCVDDETSRIVGFDSVKVYTKNENYNEFIPKAQTAEVQRYCQFLSEWNNLYPIPEVLKKYGVNKILDDVGIAIHPDYRGYKFTGEFDLLRRKLSEANAATLAGAWMTSPAVQKAAKIKGWETVYEVSTEKLGKLLGAKFQNAPPAFLYKVKRME